MATHSCTIITRVAGEILQQVEQFAGRYAHTTLLYTISPNMPADEMSPLLANMRALSPTSIGCLAAPTHGPEMITCSMAWFDTADCIPFRSTIEGTPQPQVGRGHNASRTKESPDWKEVWNKHSSPPLPAELSKVDPADVNALVYFTDSAPQGLTASLSQFMNSSRLGLIGTSTPFINGRPFTMFYNEDVYSSGAVGLALTKRPLVSSSLQFLGLEPIAEHMKVTASEGNMIHGLNGENPTQLLLAALKEKGLDVPSFKDEAIYVMHPSERHTYTITAGDPSRGPLSLHGEEAPAVGMEVQFFYRPKTNAQEIPSINSSITFLVTEEDNIVFTGGFGSGFVAGSEHGFVYDKRYICKVPGGLASITV